MIFSTFGIFLVSLVLVLFSDVPANAQALKQLGKHKDWSVYMSAQPGKTVCFAIASPKDMEPKTVSRGSVYFYVTQWPRIDGKPPVREVSIKIGYPFKEKSNVVATIKGTSFKLFAEKDYAFVSNEDDEKKLIRAMMGGRTMVVTGESARGTKTTDQYSLSGITAALKRLGKTCK